MKISECEVGIRVKCIAPFDGNSKCIGLEGTIVDYFNSGRNVGVAFDAPFTGGWDLHGLAAPMCGRYGNPSSLEKIEEFTPIFTISFDEIMGDSI